VITAAPLTTGTAVFVVASNICVEIVAVALVTVTVIGGMIDLERGGFVLVPLIVTVNVPALEAVNVQVDIAAPFAGTFRGFGLHTRLKPEDGLVEFVIVTEPEKPWTLVTVMLAVAALPTWTLTVFELGVIVKS
jgi:hypothetical protein